MSNFTRIRIDCNYPDARRAEAFLSSWEETFLPDSADKERYVFQSTVSGTRAELLFFDSYEEANLYGVKHYNPATEKQRWNLNGAMLYVVSGNDPEKVGSLASHFAGKE
ncbi:MAG TPA: hypothetical protein VHW43_05610 [Puia sp.]|jgi:hypothetical protein|nr:hypothetical protein [Puia sp.]